MIRIFDISGRCADFLLFGATVVELSILVFLTPAFTVTDWIYVLQHVVVLVVALARPLPSVQDRSLTTSAAVVVAYAYPYAQLIYLSWRPGTPAWPELGLILVMLAAILSFVSLLSLGKQFGIRPALRRLVKKGPYGIVRHPMYLAYILADVGYNLQEWNFGTVLLVLAGWASLLYRIHAEEQVLSHDAGWSKYATGVRYRLIPGLW